MTLEFTTSYLQDSADLFRHYKHLAERGMTQVPDDAFFTVLDAESNSIAIIVQHIAGNLRSRWTDFLIADGEKPDRNRDAEFEPSAKTRADLMADWEAGWKSLFDALALLTDADLPRKVYIRTEAHSVTQAINRQMTHCAYHVGQIVYLAKHFASENWSSLTIPRGRSADFTFQVVSGRLSQR